MDARGRSGRHAREEDFFRPVPGPARPAVAPGHPVQTGFCACANRATIQGALTLHPKKDPSSPVTWMEYEALRDHLTRELRVTTETFDTEIQGVNLKVDEATTAINTVQTSMTTLQASMNTLTQAVHDIRTMVQQQPQQPLDEDGSVNGDNADAAAQGVVLVVVFHVASIAVMLNLVHAVFLHSRKTMVWRPVPAASGTGSSMSTARNRDMVCHTCGGKGHFKKDCPNRKVMIINEDNEYETGDDADPDAPEDDDCDSDSFDAYPSEAQTIVVSQRVLNVQPSASTQ
ncbi:hypothetical protein QYE76_021534 [Lolium multiflorum]|uniref:CCHC-type domain-containing protein n=1 Tax=Lolium multiflorum TaxID=4521 RepID=A0AAD8R969_LOLMU|nr:hypothetical protein QYE76_021534 [Lolium multiflorum]